MDKTHLIKRLLPVVAHDSHWDRLEDYLIFERGLVVDKLITSNDIKTINRLQGEIMVIDRLLELPESVKKL